MNFLVILLLVVAATTGSKDENLWRSFKAEYTKTYKNVREERLRYRTFQQNLREIEEHNEKFEKGESTYTMGITQFSDLTNDEFMALYAPQQSPHELPISETFYANPKDNTPDSFDWRKKEGLLSEPRIQYYCGAYWAMNTVDAIESQIFLKHQKKIRLSEQELLECNHAYPNAGCVGGGNLAAFNYIIDNGIAYQKDYPYKRYVEECKNATIPKSDIKFKSYTKIEHHNEIALRQALATVGPISVMFFNTFIRNYKSGIVEIEFCPNTLWNHGGLLIGYGSENNTDYWLVQTYLGPQFGEKGCFRIRRNKNDMCGIAYEAIYPNIE